MVAMLRAIALLLVDIDIACNAAMPRKAMESTSTATSTSIRPTPDWACRRPTRRAARCAGIRGTAGIRRFCHGQAPELVEVTMIEPVVIVITRWLSALI